MITLESVSVEFKKRKIVNNFSLNISAGDKILITGASGTGKSTILKTIMGFTENFSGKIFVDGLTLNSENVNKIRRKIFFSCQDFNLGEEPLNEVVATIFQFEANKNLIFKQGEFMMLAEEIEFSPTLLEKPYKCLSSGEKQRFLILLGSVLNREIWLLDEPTSSLDGYLKEKVANFILSKNKTIVVISHDATWLDKNMKHIMFGNGP